MLMIVKNGIDTPEGKRGVRLARDMAADLVLIQNGIYFVRDGGLDDFNGKVYVLDEDLVLRGLGDAEIGKDIRKVDYDALVDIIAGSDKVVGMF
jgi:sulfur relay protein TusB/DsrH